MVLDEVESAGNHRRDCLPHSGSPGRSAAAGGGGGGGAKDSWACELLRRGWGLTRTAAIAGAAATAAPVVAPPLIVLSAAGVALSVPFAAYLASLAAANHLTGALLRSCQPPPRPCPQEYDDLEQEFLDAAEEYGQEAPAFGHLGTVTEQGIVGEEDGSDTSLPLSRDPGALADDEVEGEFSAQELSASSKPLLQEEDNLDQKRGEDEFSAPSKPLLQEEDNLVQKRGEDEFSAPSKPLLQEEDTLVQKRGGDEFSVLNSDQQLLQSNNGKEKEDGLYSKSNEEDDRTMEENKSAKKTVSQGFCFPELGVPASGADDDNVVQEKGEDELSVHNSGQQPFQFQSKNFREIEEEDGKTMEENKPTKETVSQEAPAFGYLDTETEQDIMEEENESDTSPLLPRDPGVSESSAAVFADDEVEEEVQGEFSAQESGHGSYMSNRRNDTEEHTPLEGTESTQKETLPRGLDVSALAKQLFSKEDNVIQGEKNNEEAVQVSGDQLFQSKNWNETDNDVYSKEEGDGKAMEENKSREETVLRGFCSPESRMPLSGEDDDNVVQEKGEGKFVARNSGQQSFQSKNLNENVEEDGKTTEENKPTKETLFYELCVPASGDEDNVVLEKRGGEFSVQSSGQLTFQSKIWNEKKEDDKTTEENKSTEVMHSEGSYFPESSVPASGEDDDNVVQEKGEGKFDAQNSGQQSFQSKNLNEKVEEDGKTTEGNKSTKEIPFYESSVPASGDEDNVVQEEREGEFSVQSSGQLPFQSKIWNEKEEDDKTIEKSTEVMHSEGSHFPEWSVPALGDEDKKGENEFYLHNLGQHSLLSDMGHKKEHGITMEKNKPTEDMPPRDPVGSELPAPVFHGEDNVVQSKEGFEVAVEGVLEEANSNTDLVMAEVVDDQVEIIVIAAPESEVLPPSIVMAEVVDVQVEISATAAPDSEVLSPSNLVAPELHPDIITGEVNDAYVGIVAAVEPESEVLHESNLAAGASMADPGTGEISDVQANVVASAKPEDEVLHKSDLADCASTADLGIGELSDVQVNVVAAAKPEDEVLPLRNLTEPESQVVVETAHVGDIVGIAAARDNVRGFGDLDKQGMECCFVPVASMHDTEDVMSSGSTPYFSTMGEEIIDLSDQSSDVGYTVRNEAFGSKVVAESEAHYTEEQLREQLDTIRTITGYGAVPSSTLEGELAGLYIFVGVEPPVGSGDTSDRLMALSAELRFLKSIIGVD